MRHYLLTISLVCIFLSCKGQDRVQIVSFNTDSFAGFDKKEPERELYRDSSKITYSVFVSGKTIIVTHPRGENSHAIDLLDLDTQEPLNHLIDFEEEWFSPLASLYKDTLIVRDNIVNRVALVDIGEAARDRTYKPETREVNYFSVRFIPVGKRFIFWNPYGHDQRFPRVLVSDEDGNYEYPPSTPKTEPHNVDHGDLLFNKEKDIIVLAHKNEPTIDLMHSDGIIYKKLEFDHPAPEIGEFNIGGTIKYIYKGKTINYFPSASSVKNLFAVAYAETGSTSKILFFDWDGNLTSGFKVAGECIHSISFSPEGKYVYSWEKDGNSYVLREYQSGLE